jgi:hypothetical protein
MMRAPFRFLRLWPLLLVALALNGNAVLFYSSADPAKNSSPPTGSLAKNGWHSQGEWAHSYLGTAVSPYFFLTAAHFGGEIGSSFTLDGEVFLTVASFRDPESDLILWKVNRPMPNWVELYTGSDEVNREVVVFGRGGPRGEAVTTGALLGSSVRGWKAGPADGVKRWGENQVHSITPAESFTGNAAWKHSSFLRCAFNSSGGANEAHLSIGDSGGGLFIREGNVWKLAGINYAVDGFYNTSVSGPGFSAAIFDEGGLFKGSEGNWRNVPDLPTDQSGGFYATRVSPRIAWIQQVIDQHSPFPESVEVEFATAPHGPFSKISAAIDLTAMVARINRSPESSFFRLVSGNRLRITRAEFSGEQLLLFFSPH